MLFGWPAILIGPRDVESHFFSRKETWIEFLAPGFGPAEAQCLQAENNCSRRRKNTHSLSLSLSTFQIKQQKNKITCVYYHIQQFNEILTSCLELSIIKMLYEQSSKGNSYLQMLVMF